MKNSQVSEFFEMAAKDRELSARIAEIEKEAASRLVALAQECGFACSIEDSPRIIWRKKAIDGELSENDLDEVAGGGLGRGSFWPEK